MNRVKQQKSKFVPIVGIENTENSVPTIFILLAERRKSGEIRNWRAKGCRLLHASFWHFAFGL